MPTADESRRNCRKLLANGQFVNRYARRLGSRRSRNGEKERHSSNGRLPRNDGVAETQPTRFIAECQNGSGPETVSGTFFIERQAGICRLDMVPDILT